MKSLYLKQLFFVLIAFSFLKPNYVNAQCVTGNEFDITTPKKDMRGVFLPSVFSISWPSDRNATPAVQQAELIAMLDDMQVNGYNSVFLQVRPECDALYASAIEPWSYWLTGTEGTAPSPFWDPLDFAVTEAHLRGLELHAWLNPYRSKRGSQTRAANHVSVLHPDWVFMASNSTAIEIMDPGLPAVEAYIVSVVEDIASRYDVDGIHFDDYFYPSGGMATNQDAATFAANNPGGLSLEDWRRDNVNRMITEVYDAIQTINTNDNKNISFGVSPFGIWKNGVPSGTTGTSSYDALFCDPIAWMQAGKVDYIAPQVYWDLNSSGQDYNLLTQWWNDQADTYNTQVYVSQAYYKMIDSNNWPASELQGQINFNRITSMDATFGQIAYRYNEIDNDSKGINGALNGAQFQYKSFVAPILGTGKDVVCPMKPDNIRFGPLKVMWDTPAAAADGDLPRKYVVYAFDNAAQATTNKNDGSKILDIVAGNELTLTQSQIDTKFIVVTSLDKNNNEAGDFCNFPLQDITAACSVASITAPTAKNNCTGSFTATTATVFPITSTTVVTWTYDFGGGETLIQNQNVIIDTPITEYTGAGWSNGVPDTSKKAVISINYNTSTANIDACSCEVSSGATLTVAAGDYLKVDGNITVDGSLIVEHQGSVVQVDGAASVTNNGTINVELTTPFLKPFDFMIMGSPMTAETHTDVFGSAYIVRDHHTGNFIPNGAVAAAFPLAENFADDNGNNWLTYSGTINPAEGYMVFPQASSGDGNATYDLTYTQGTLNNGDHTFTALYNGTQNGSPNVLANPYASSIFADDFINANSNVDALYFWEHITPPSAGIPGYSTMNFTMEDISMYNLTGGTAATTGGTTPNGYIATGQGFGIKASAGGPVSFTNAMRRVDNNNTLRTQNDRDRLWLSVRNEQYEMQSNTLLGFLEEASSGVDTGYDSKRLATVVSLYSHLPSGDLEFGIQARESFDPQMTIPMGFSSLIESELTYRISIEQLEGINLSDATVYLVDHYENTITNLNQEAYDFVSYGGTYNNRFTIQFETEILETNDVALESIVMYPNPTKDLLTIVSPTVSIQAVTVYDISGRKVSENSFGAKNVYQVDLSDLESAIYLVEITTEKGTTTKQVVKQ